MVKQLNEKKTTQKKKQAGRGGRVAVGRWMGKKKKSKTIAKVQLEEKIRMISVKEKKKENMNKIYSGKGN